MCTRFTLTAEAEEIINHYNLSQSDFPVYKKVYNASASQQILSVIHNGSEFRAGNIEWGIPSKTKGTKQEKPIINIRKENLSDHAMYRESFQRRRIIIPADGFYEWMNTNQGKQPIRIVLSSNDLFSLAAVYESWETTEGKKSACAIVTTESNRIVAPFNNRMPVILKDDDEAIWLDRSIKDMEQLRSFLKPYRADLMKSYPVTQLVNDSQYNSPMLIKEVSLEEKLF